MKLILLSVVLCVAIYAASATKLIASSSRAMNRRETKLVRRLVKRQAYNGRSTGTKRKVRSTLISSLQILIAILVDVPFPTAARTRFQQRFQVNAVNDVSRWSTHKP